MLNRFCILSLVHLSTAPFPVQAQWEQTNGPPSGYITDFQAVGGNLYASTITKGVFRSTDRGATWTAMNDGLIRADVSTLASIGDHLFAGTGDGVFLTTNGGTSWAGVKNGLTNTNIRALAVNGTRLFAGTDEDGIFRSDDSGKTWTAFNTGLTKREIHTITVHHDSTGGTTIYAGTSTAAVTIGGLFRTTDNGVNWTEIITGYNQRSVSAIAIRRENLFIGTDGNGVLLSKNNGMTWESINNSLSDPNINAFTVDSSGTIFAGTLGGVFLFSDNDGPSWNGRNKGLTDRWVFSLWNDGRNLFAGTARGIYTSTNAGDSWSSTGLIVSAVYSLATDPKQPGTLVAGTNRDGPYISTDNGMSWSSIVSANLSWPRVEALYINDSNLFAGVFQGGVYHSPDLGRNWVDLTDNNGFTDYDVSSLVCMDTVMFAGTYRGGIFRSSNGGVSWSPVTNGLPAKPIRALAVIPDRPGFILAGTQGNGVYLSTDRGGSWSASNQGMAGKVVTTLAGHGTHLFAGTDQRMFHTTDYGTSWTAAGNGLPIFRQFHGLTVLPDGSGNVFTGAWGAGIFHSSNYGESWRAVNEGLPMLEVMTLAASETYLFAGTPGRGVWRRRLSEILTGTGNGTSPIPVSAELAPAYPNPFAAGTILEFSTSRHEFVLLGIYDILGNEVATLVKDYRPAGTHRVAWNAEKDSRGVYIARLQAGNVIRTRFLVLMK